MPDEYFPTQEDLTRNWHSWPLDAIPLDKPIIALWKSANGRWMSNKFDGYEFYQRGAKEPFNDIPVRWIYYNPKDQIEHGR